MSVRREVGKTRWRLLAGAATLAGLILPLALAPVRLTLRGWLRGEPCYDGRPLSYWRHQLGDWRIGGEFDLGLVEDEAGRKAKGTGWEFWCVSGHPGKWSLQHRDTWAQRARREPRVFRAKLTGQGSGMNPTYGEPFCRLAILEGDPAAVPVLTALLGDEDLVMRRHAAAALGTVGPQARAAFPALLATALKDRDPLLRGIARTVLLDIDREAAQKAGIVDHFLFWSPQPRLLAAIRGSFFLNTPGALLAEGKILAWDDKDQAVALVELATGGVLASFRAPADCALPTVFSPDGKTAASASKDKRTVRAWELATGKVVATLRGHAGDVEALAFSPDGKTLASGSSDTTVKLWEVSTGRNTATLRGHSGRVGAVAFSPGGRVLASGGVLQGRSPGEIVGGSHRQGAGHLAARPRHLGRCPMPGLQPRRQDPGVGQRGIPGNAGGRGRRQEAGHHRRGGGGRFPGFRGVQPGRPDPGLRELGPDLSLRRGEGQDHRQDPGRAGPRR
jgi:hypothetical protein